MEVVDNHGYVDYIINTLWPNVCTNINIINMVIIGFDNS